MCACVLAWRRVSAYVCMIHSILLKSPLLPWPCASSLQAEAALRAALRFSDVACGKLAGGDLSLWRGIASRLLVLEAGLAEGNVAALRRVMIEAVGASAQAGDSDPAALETVRHIAGAVCVCCAPGGGGGGGGGLSSGAFVVVTLRCPTKSPPFLLVCACAAAAAPLSSASLPQAVLRGFVAGQTPCTSTILAALTARGGESAKVDFIALWTWVSLEHAKATVTDLLRSGDKHSPSQVLPPPLPFFPPAECWVAGTCGHCPPPWMPGLLHAVPPRSGHAGVCVCLAATQSPSPWRCR